MSSKFNGSESDMSGESSAEGSPSIPPQPPPRNNQKKKSSRNHQNNWEVLEGLKEGQTYDRVPKKFEGFVLKKRKWPLKGYHKRYFVLENGVIIYGKNGWDLQRGKVHGSLDAGMCVISTKPRDGRVDIDSEDSIYHLKIKPKEVYMEWLEQLKQHRLYRQHLLSVKGSPLTEPVKEVSIERELHLVEKDISNLAGILDSMRDNNKNDNKMKDFVIVAKDVIVSLRGIVRAVSSAKDNEGLATLKHTLNIALQQNAEFKSKLARIQREATVIEYPAIQNSDTIKSFSSTTNSEYYDAITNAEDRTSSDEESLSDDGESINSESSELTKFDNDLTSLSSSAPPSAHRTLTKIYAGTRRQNLPCPAPTDVPSLWGILKKNIGKDLSRVSMPVALNEPLGVLQRMCEELEYCELLDQACKEPDPIERMALIAAFTVSGYANGAYRTHKPFNSLLGETYECDREDKGFRFIAEQVSHHPPISACFSEGNFKGWQFNEETQIKSKFWGKTMEIQPLGSASVSLIPHSETYTYNKATTCVHNLFSSSKWVDLYGQVMITCGKYKCTLNYIRASYWNTQKNDVQGTIMKDGVTVRNLHGRWNESFFIGQPPSSRCLWRMGNLPDDYSKFYGFTRFAIELNEHCENTCSTDTRLRPDQRLLEEGDLAGAEAMKISLEQSQRERRKIYDEEGITYSPKWFKKDPNGNSWEYNGQYWIEKKNNFKNITVEKLW